MNIPNLEENFFVMNVLSSLAKLILKSSPPLRGVALQQQESNNSLLITYFFCRHFMEVICKGLIRIEMYRYFEQNVFSFIGFLKIDCLCLSRNYSLGRTVEENRQHVFCNDDEEQFSLL